MSVRLALHVKQFLARHGGQASNSQTALRELRCTNEAWHWQCHRPELRTIRLQLCLRMAVGTEYSSKKKIEERKIEKVRRRKVSKSQKV